MARCDVCNREMHTAEGCTKNPIGIYKTERSKRPFKVLDPITYGSETWIVKLPIRSRVFPLSGGHGSGRAGSRVMSFRSWFIQGSGVTTELSREGATISISNLRRTRRTRSRARDQWRTLAHCSDKAIEAECREVCEMADLEMPTTRGGQVIVIARSWELVPPV